MSDTARSRELAGWLLELGTGRLEPAALVESLAVKLEGMGIPLFRVSVWLKDVGEPREILTLRSLRPGA